MSANDNNPAAQEQPGIFAVFQTTLQRVREKVTGATKDLALPSSLMPSPADGFVAFSNSSSIEERNGKLKAALEGYASHQPKGDRDKDKLNKAIIRLFDKPADFRSQDEHKYFRRVDSSANKENFVEPNTIFERLLYAETPKPSSNGISSLALAFVTILSLSVNRGNGDKNLTSPYFDLSPLYGSNENETNSIRKKDGSGMLHPDCFCEDRFDQFPDAVALLLVLWNRYHNYIAKYLLWHNQENRWRDLTDPNLALSQDDQIFNLARSITCINFMNVVKEDILKGLLGLPFVGPSLEADILHDVRGIKGRVGKGYGSTMEAHFLYDFPSFISAAPNQTDFADDNFQRRNYMGLKRNQKGYFEDTELAEVLFNTIETSPNAAGALNIPDCAREATVEKIRRARDWNICTLNEFRQHLGLKPLESFEQWNPDSLVADAAKALYGHINNLELYPGLLAEKPTGNSGFGFGCTLTWGLISDIVTRIRRDPRFTDKFAMAELTKWGFEDCMPRLRHAEGSFGAVIPKLLERSLPHNCAYQSVYSVFPFTVPKAAREHIERLVPDEKQRKKYDFDRPKARRVKVLRTIKAISEVFNDPASFPSPYKRTYAELTGGYGHMLGFDELTLHDHDLMVTMFSLLPDSDAAKRIGTAFAEKARDNLMERCNKIGEKRARIDVISDVIDATCVGWVCEMIYDKPLQDIHGTDSKASQTAAREEERKARKNFEAFYAHVFRNSEPEIGWKVREQALLAIQELRGHLEKKLSEITKHNDEGFVAWWIEFIKRVRSEYSYQGKILPNNSAQTFLDRMMKAVDQRPLKDLIGKTPHLKELEEKYKKEYKQCNPDSSPAEVEEEARKHVEKDRIIANVLGLSVVISVQFAKVCSQAVDFYLDEKYEAERQKLIELCTNPKTTNEKIMEYIREAQRIGHKFGLSRDVALAPGVQRVIQQGHGHPAVIIEEGDRVYADFASAHNDPHDFPEPNLVKPGRRINSLQGLGLHKCPAGSFIDETMAEIFRVIFSQGDLQRSKQNGRLNTTTLHPNAAQWDAEIYLDDEEGFSFCPRKLVLEFDYKEKPEAWEFGDDKKFLYLNWSLTGIKIFLVLIILIWKFISFPVPSFDLWPQTSVPSAQVPANLICNEPKEILPWTTMTFRPKWYLFGEPTSIEHRTRGKKAHQISVTAIDKKDTQLQFSVDDYKYAIREVDLDPNVNCGEDVNACLGQGFSSVLIQVPPGRHTFKTEIVKQNGTFSWNGERKRRIKMRVEQCDSVQYL